MTITLDESALHDMRLDLEKAYPDEGCGFVFGREDTVRRIDRILPVINTRDENRRRRFEISATDYMRAESYALQHNTQLLGIYHSHPDHPARPSDYDLKHALPYFSYLIMSVDKGVATALSSWQLDDTGAFAEEAVEIENQKNTHNL
jgi:proteasome lid subunit RPN8/RPN11